MKSQIVQGLAGVSLRNEVGRGKKEVGGGVMRGREYRRGYPPPAGGVWGGLPQKVFSF